MRKRAGRKGRPEHIQIEASITNNNLEILKAIVAEYGGVVSCHPNKRRMCHKVRWTNKESISVLLRRIAKHLILKKPNAELMLKYIFLRPPHKRSPLSVSELSLADQMGLLNSKLRFR